MDCFNWGKRSIRGLLMLSLLLMTSGCPDFSHQAPLPDYSNMTDEGAEESDVAAESGQRQ